MSGGHQQAARRNNNERSRNQRNIRRITRDTASTTILRLLYRVDAALRLHAAARGGIRRGISAATSWHHKICANACIEHRLASKRRISAARIAYQWHHGIKHHQQHRHRNENNRRRRKQSEMSMARGIVEGE